MNIPKYMMFQFKEGDNFLWNINGNIELCMVAYINKEYDENGDIECFDYVIEYGKEYEREKIQLNYGINLH